MKKYEENDIEEDVLDCISKMKQTIEKTRSDCKEELVYSFGVLDVIFKIGSAFLDNEIIKSSSFFPTWTNVAFGEMMVTADRITDEILLGRYRAVSAEVRYVFEYLVRAIFIDKHYENVTMKNEADKFKSKLEFWMRNKDKKILSFSNMIRTLNPLYKDELFRVYKNLCQEIHPDRYFTHPFVVADLIENPQNYVDPQFLKTTIETVKDAYDLMFYMILDYSSNRILVSTRENAEAIQKHKFNRISEIIKIDLHT
jgi:hypothetical protein